MRPNQRPDRQLVFEIAGFEWPGNPLVCSRLEGHEFTVPRQSAEILLQALRDNPGAYVSCQDQPVFSLNPNYSNQVTPQALHGFPRDFLAYMAHYISSGQTRALTSGIEYAHRQNLYIFDLDGPVADSDTYTYTNACLQRDIECLRNLWTPHGVAGMDLGFAVQTGGLAGIADNWLRSLSRNSNHAYGQHLQNLVYASESFVDAMLGTQNNGDYQPHACKPMLWRHVLAGLGYSALVDRHNLLTGDVEQQVVSVDPSRIRNPVHIENPMNAAVRMLHQRELAGLVRHPGPR